ncbi:hypothetical protein C8F04DRAFT_1248450 [Mycena alexandri]|uniref:CxC2-like cysteine cluster KDZ transposase-associated domain-containing protein n=1 Tax=Mycena alexandri TaxID=1745969 RepID=A0AAD6TJN6_9AGAR|nr:hypothetical protein C8F04DRAFT_1248450 [Mycena alexandri]
MLNYKVKAFALVPNGSLLTNASKVDAMDKLPSRAVIFKAIRESESDGPKHSDVPAPQWLCAPCMIVTHERNPLHRIEWWDNKEFTKTGLQSIGMRIKLGHRGQFCPTPVGDEHFRIIDSAGVHKVSVDFCGCPTACTRGEQLMASRLYPQRREPPRIAVAFQMAYALEASGASESTVARHLEKIT